LEIKIVNEGVYCFISGGELKTYGFTADDFRKDQGVNEKKAEFFRILMEETLDGYFHSDEALMVEVKTTAEGDVVFIVKRPPKKNNIIPFRQKRSKNSEKEGK
jgi:negative regulator of genetic competence, sporulation and motility